MQNELLGRLAVAAVFVVTRLLAAIAFDGIEAVFVNIAGDIATVEAGGLEIRQVGANSGHRLLERIDVLIDQRIGTDLAGNAVIGTTGGDQFGARRHVMPAGDFFGGILTRPHEGVDIMAQRVEHHTLDTAVAALLANGLDGAGEALRILVNEASKIECTHFLKARPNERMTERTDYADGFKPKAMTTRVDERTFDVPQVRGGGFYPSAPEKGSRTEQAPTLALPEMYVQGVSTRKVCDIRAIFNAPDKAEAERLLRQALDAWKSEVPKLGLWADEDLPEGFTEFGLPRCQRAHLRTTSGLERINREIKRRIRVAPTFPNTASCLRLVSAPLAECDEEWMTGKVYLDLLA